jgi:hypothetical protein
MTYTTPLPQKTNWPQQKVLVPAVAGFLVALIVFILNNFVITDEKKKVPSELSALAIPVLTGLLAYWIPPGRDERIIECNQDGQSENNGKYVKSAKIKKPTS